MTVIPNSRYIKTPPTEDEILRFVTEYFHLLLSLYDSGYTTELLGKGLEIDDEATISIYLHTINTSLYVGLNDEFIAISVDVFFDPNPELDPRRTHNLTKLATHDVSQYNKHFKDILKMLRV